MAAQQLAICPLAEAGLTVTVRAVTVTQSLWVQTSSDIVLDADGHVHCDSLLFKSYLDLFAIHDLHFSTICHSHWLCTGPCEWQIAFKSGELLP